MRALMRIDPTRRPSRPSQTQRRTPAAVRMQLRPVRQLTRAIATTGSGLWSASGAADGVIAGSTVRRAVPSRLALSMPAGSRSIAVTGDR